MAKAPKRDVSRRIYHVSYFEPRRNKYGTLVNINSKPEAQRWVTRFQEAGYVDIRVFEYHLKKTHVL